MFGAAKSDIVLDGDFVVDGSLVGVSMRVLTIR